MNRRVELALRSKFEDTIAEVEDFGVENEDETEGGFFSRFLSEDSILSKIGKTE
jgi:hypothetical protein